MIRNHDILILLLVLIIVAINLGLLILSLKRKVFRKYLFTSIILSGLIGLLILSNNYSRIKYWVDRYRIENREVQKPIPNPSCRCTSTSLHFQRDSYAKKHRPMAQKTTKNRFIEDKKKLKELLKDNHLVKISDGDGYHIQGLKNSSKHLTPLAKKRLVELGTLFRENLNGTPDAKSYFIVSSVTRTDGQQCIIRKAYPRSATQQKSTHSYGVSVDISRVIYMSSCKEALKALERAIDQMQGEGKLLICPEKGCIHLTFV
jgi:hypothetical protein